MAKKEYILKNREWLEAKSKESGVLPLSRGIFYKVLSSGNPEARQPHPNSMVTAHYRGTTINGKQFDSSFGGRPFTCRLCDLIDGWIVAMQQMHVGDRWEVYIPYEMGYGLSNQPGIPGGSTLIFEIELIGVS